jgi:hypothetical protein
MLGTLGAAAAVVVPSMIVFLSEPEVPEYLLKMAVLYYFTHYSLLVSPSILCKITACQ